MPLDSINALDWQPDRISIDPPLPPVKPPEDDGGDGKRSIPPWNKYSLFYLAAWAATTAASCTAVNLCGLSTVTIFGLTTSTLGLVSFMQFGPRITQEIATDRQAELSNSTINLRKIQKEAAQTIFEVSAFMAAIGGTAITGIVTATLYMADDINRRNERDHRATVFNIMQPDAHRPFKPHPQTHSLFKPQ